MRNLSKTVMSFAILVSVGACDRNQKAAATKHASAVDPLAADTERMEAKIRIDAANKRIDELERKVGALEATPEKIDLDLLTQRVTALEVKSIGDLATEPQAILDSETPTPASGTPRSGSGGRRTPTGSSKPTLPKLESRARLATPAEANAFSPGK